MRNAKFFTWMGVAATLLVGAQALADDPIEKIQGSDTLAGAMTDAIIAAGMNQEITYVGGGSSTGETAMLNGQQGIAPMSREVSAQAVAQAAQQGVTFVPHVIGLDGVAVFVNASNPMHGIDFATLIKVFSCATTRWEQIPGSGMTGPIKVLRRNDQSGTTDTFKKLVGLDAFGPCVNVVAETIDIANGTASDASAIGYAGLSGQHQGNKALAVAKSGTAFAAPTVANIRSFKYPLARKLFVYSVSGARTPNAVEERLLSNVTDRSFMDPIIQNNEFFTID